MDEKRFDDAIRALNGSMSRRRGIAAAIGALLGGAAAAEATAKDRKRGAVAAGDDANVEGPCGDGSRKANRCKRNSQCCTKYCLFGTCRLKPNQMQCAKGSECASGSCVNNKCDGGCKKEGSRCSTSANCCNGLVCEGGVCKSSTKAVCNSKNCKGCCNGTVCRAGTSVSACGTKGGTCARCRNGATCVNGACFACDAATCPTGCCQNGVCQAGTAASACGTGGVACAACSGTDVCTAGTCGAACTPTLQSISGTGDSEISNPKGVYLSTDKLTLFIASWNPADIAIGGRVSIWTRTSAGAWVFQQKLESTNLLKPGFVTASADGNTIATMSEWNDCGVVFKLTGGVWAETGTLGTCASGGSGNNELSSPTSVALNADGTTAYIGDKSNGRISVWKLTGSTWAYDSSILSAGGGGQCGTGSDPNVKTCPYGVFVNATEDKIYICSGALDRGLQLLTKSGSTWTGAWAGPVAPAPYGGIGCWVDPTTENVLANDLSGGVKLSNFATGVSWDAVPLAQPPTSAVAATSVREFTPASPDTAFWAFAEGFSGVQATACGV
jgi:hypothetical protein